MWEFLHRHLLITVACAAILLVGLGFATSATHPVATASHDGHVAIMHHGSAGHQQIVFNNGTTSSAQLIVASSEQPTTGHGMQICASTTGNNFEGMAAFLRHDQLQGTGTTYNGTMAALNRETWLMETNSGGFGHRLSAARIAGHQQVSFQVMQADTASFYRRAA